MRKPGVRRSQQAGSAGALSQAPPGRPGRWELACLAVIVAVAAVPRLHLLGIWPGVSCDVCKVGVLAYRFCTYGEISWNPNIGYIGPVQTLVGAAMRSLFGTSVLSTRAPVAIMALLAVLMAWAVVRRVLGPPAAVATAAVAAAYPWLIMASRYALEPMWLVLPNAVMLWMLVRYVQHGRTGALVAVGGLAGLGLTLHPAQVVALPGVAVAVLWAWISRRVRVTPLKVIPAAAAFVIMAGPVLPYHLNSLLGRQEVAAKKLQIGWQHPADYFAPALEIATGRQLYRYFGSDPGPATAGQRGLEAILVLGLVAGGVTLWRRGGLAGRVLVVYFLVGVAVGFVFCSGMNRLQILGHSRYLICLALLLPMLWAAGLVGLIDQGRLRWIRLVGAVGLAGALAVLPWQLGRYYFGGRTRSAGGLACHHQAYEGDPKELAAWYIRHNRLEPERTVILAQDYDMYYPLRYFLEDGYHIQTLVGASFIPANDHYPFQALAADPDADWIVAMYPRSYMGPRLKPALERYGLLRPEHIVYEVRGPNRSASPILVLYRIPPSESRKALAARLAQSRIRIPPSQGRIPPSGTGKIPRPPLGPQHF